jgi:hypothetical protein
VVDQLDYLVALARLRILDALAGPLPETPASPQRQRDDEKIEERSRDRALKSRACQSVPYRPAKTQRAMKESPPRQWWRISSALALPRKTG